MRAQLISELRPKVEEELRRKLIVALRPALEAEIRTKLTAALLPRVKQEVLDGLNDQLPPASPAQIQPRQEPSGHAATLRQSLQDSVASANVAQQQSLMAMQEAAFQTDLAGKNVYVNQAWTQLTGYSVADTLGRPLAEFFIAEVRRGVAVCLDRVARGRATQSFVEAYLARKAAGPLRVEVHAAPLTTNAGDIIGVCGTLRDAGAAQERKKDA